VVSGAAWIERPRRGRLSFTGRDAVSFLQALLTNDLASLAVGEGAYAAYLTPQGRLLADLAVYRWPDRVIADVPAPQAAALAARFDLLVFTEDVRVVDESAAIAQLTVIGEGAAAALDRVLAVEDGTVGSLPLRAHATGGGIVAARTDDLDVPSYDLFVPSERRGDVETALAAAGVGPLGPDLFEALRIEAGRPSFGVDMTEETIPLEAGLLDRAISLSKGCYVGQEVIVRVLHRGGGRVARRLVRIVFEASTAPPPPPGTAIHAGGREVGRVTSAARSPRIDRVVALGYVHRDAAQVGGEIVVGALGGRIAGFAG